MAQQRGSTLPGYDTATEYGAKQGVSTETVRRRIRDGSLPALKIGGTWLIRVGKGHDDASK